MESLKLELTKSAGMAKAGMLLPAILLLCTVIGLARWGIQGFQESVILGLVFLGIAALLAAVFFTVLNSAFYKEWLIVTKKDLTIVHKSFTNEQRYTLPLRNITHFGFSDTRFEKTVKPGLQPSGKEYVLLAHDGNILIETGERLIRFGRKIASWEIEELIEKTEAFSGVRLKLARSKEKED